MTNAKKTVHCGHCGSENVCLDANIKWNVATQRWETGSSVWCEGLDCLDCDKTSDVVTYMDPETGIATTDRPDPVPQIDLVRASCLAEVAMCLWEAALEWIAADEFDDETLHEAWSLIEERRSQIGMSELRMWVKDLAEDCENDYQLSQMFGLFDDAFDWEFCPVWLAHRVIKEFGDA